MKRFLTTALVAAACAAAACTDAQVDKAKADTGAAVDATKSGAEKAMDATKKAGDKTLEATKDAAATTADKAKEVAGDVADKSKELASAAGEVVTDTWITGKLKAKFADEKVLDGSAISIDTKDHLVTLTGTVPSAAAHARALEIARGTEGVKQVVDKLVIKKA
ncbi:MAG: BON domain-containing protein [Vicinamibacterales bacterium]